jgi:hypothetical protein
MIVAGHFLVNYRMASGVLSKGVVGHFEARDNSAEIFFPIGYSTDAALQGSGWFPKQYQPPRDGIAPAPSMDVLTGPWVIPVTQRKYDVSFVGQVGPRSAYAHRRQLGCSWVTGGRSAHSDRMFVHLRGAFGPCVAGGERETMERLPDVDARNVLANSRFFLALTGDTPTTDRLNNCFDTLTIPIALSSKVNSIVGSLAFRDVVLWHQIFVVVNQGAWNVNPIQAVLDTIDTLSDHEVAVRVRLMRRHADDLSFARPYTTRMHTRLINSAWQAMQKRYQNERVNVTTSVRPRPGLTGTRRRYRYSRDGLSGSGTALRAF